MADLVEVVAALYALEPEEFVSARDARAAELRRAGDRESATRVKALRKPSVAAAAVNRLVRARPSDVAGLLEVGEALRKAQEDLSRDDLRELNRQRQGAVAALARVAAQLAADAGRPLTEAVTRLVEGTLTAAMADPDAADAVRSGLLTAHLEYAGFGFGSLADVVALPLRRHEGEARPNGRGTDRRDTARRRQVAAAIDEARQAAVAARGAANTAARDLEGATERADAAARARQAADERVDALTAELAGARAAQREASRAAADATRALAGLAARLTAAEQDLTAAESRLAEVEAELRLLDEARER